MNTFNCNVKVARRRLDLRSYSPLSLINDQFLNRSPPVSDHFVNTVTVLFLSQILFQKLSRKRTPFPAPRVVA